MIFDPVNISVMWLVMFELGPIPAFVDMGSTPMLVFINNKIAFVCPLYMYIYLVRFI